MTLFLFTQPKETINWIWIPSGFSLFYLVRFPMAFSILPIVYSSGTGTSSASWVAGTKRNVRNPTFLSYILLWVIQVHTYFRVSWKLFCTGWLTNAHHQLFLNSFTYFQTGIFPHIKNGPCHVVILWMITTST